MADAERSGVVSTALGFLALYRDPVLARATEVSRLLNRGASSTGARPVSLYLVIPPEEISRLKALLRLVLNQILKRLTEVASQNRAGRRVLLMLDEFPQLGKLDFFEHALAYIRGYRIKACLVAQSLNQIVQAYGEHSSILDNAHVRVAFACNDERTARRISDMLGVTTETRAQMNYAGSRMAPWLGHTMVSRQEVPRPAADAGRSHAAAACRRADPDGRRAAHPREESALLFGTHLSGAPEAAYCVPPPFPQRPADSLVRPVRVHDTPLSPRSQSDGSQAHIRGHTHGQDQSEQALQNTFNFSTPRIG
jgi:type IV secretion system protein VirD4